MISVFDRVENILGKGENAGNRNVFNRLLRAKKSQIVREGWKFLSIIDVSQQYSFLVIIHSLIELSLLTLLEHMIQSRFFMIQMEKKLFQNLTGKGENAGNWQPTGNKWRDQTCYIISRESSGIIRNIC